MRWSLASEQSPTSMDIIGIYFIFLFSAVVHVSLNDLTEFGNRFNRDGWH